jgi:hypothetical protein
LNPGPHGPESCEVQSSHGDFCGIQFDSLGRRARTVQIGTNLQPDYYMKYYRMQVVQRGRSVLIRCDRASPATRTQCPSERFPFRGNDLPVPVTGEGEGLGLGVAQVDHRLQGSE